MPKIENIIQPDKETWLKKFRFGTDVRVRFCETDALGHLNNVSYFIYYEQARLDYFRELGLTEKLLNDDQSYVVTADLYCQFLDEVYFDEELEVKLRTTKLGNTSFDLEYGLLRKDKGTVAATGRGAIVLVDKNTHKSTPLPDELSSKIKEYEPEL